MLRLAALRSTFALACPFQTVSGQWVSRSFTMYTAKPSGSMPAGVMLQLAAPRDAFTFVGAFRTLSGQWSAVAASFTHGYGLRAS
jgi:hypothetical protein